MSILDLFKTEHSEQADVAVEPGSSFDFLSTESKRPTITDMAGEGEPGEITDEHYPWIQKLFAGALPSQDYFETNNLLAQIVDILNSQRQNTVPTDLTHTVNRVVNAQTVASQTPQQIILEDISPYGYIYAPANKNSVITSYRVYKGYGTTDLIWDGSNQFPMSLRIPNIDVITILFDSDISVQTNFQCYLSVRPFQSSSQSGGSELGGMFPPVLSNQWYDTSDPFGGTGAARAMVADNYYTSYLYFPDNTPVKSVALNVTVAGTAATVARVSLYTVTNKPIVNINPGTTDVLANFLVQCADLPIDAIANVQAAFNFTFKAKTLYIAIVHAQSNCTVDGVTNQVSQFRSGIGSAQLSGFLKALAFGPPPAVINGVLGFLGTVPRIMFQAV